MRAREAKRLLLLGLCGALALLFAGLGIWQVDRLQWKLDLIERVEARLAAPPVAVPERSTWGNLQPRDIEYRRIRATGRFDHGRATLVDALTERGAGNWLLVPLITAEGPILVNRGFVPKGWPPSQSATDEVTVTGLLRLTEAGGRFLRPNQPKAGRWFSRDVEAIASVQGLTGAAPFFIDADASPAAGPGAYPVGGLTVVRFRNTHLLYALTWFALAALSLWGVVLTSRSSAKRG